MRSYQSFDTIVIETERCLTRHSRDDQPILVCVYFVDQRNSSGSKGENTRHFIAASVILKYKWYG
jgi:hypothetical protein